MQHSNILLHTLSHTLTLHATPILTCGGYEGTCGVHMCFDLAHTTPTHRAVVNGDILQDIRHRACS